MKHWGEKNYTIGPTMLPESNYDGSGSNAWVIAGKHTENGKNILANDPHLGYILPAVFYLLEGNLINSNK